jgi:hypothetical protein
LGFTESLDRLTVHENNWGTPIMALFTEAGWWNSRLPCASRTAAPSHPR